MPQGVWMRKDRLALGLSTIASVFLISWATAFAPGFVTKFFRDEPEVIEPVKAVESTSSGGGNIQKPEQQEPSARCRDDTLSYSSTPQGTCSRHGGVAEWLNQEVE
jgi:hypothetical protein